MSITVGLHLSPQHGDMARMREAWMEAEALGVDRIYTADHFHAMTLTKDVVKGEHAAVPPAAKNFEGTTIQAAMAATTTRAEIGCLVHGNSYRNPNLMADIARTIDHISGGRFVLGMGSGYLKPDYDEYGYDYGTQASRLNDLARDLPIIKSRFTKLNPPPLRHIPILIASAGDKIGLRIVAEHADIWNIYGPIERLIEKRDILEQHCKDIGRDPAEIEYTVSYFPDLLPDTDLDKYAELGFKHIIALSVGPDWDLGRLREVLAWRDARQKSV
jgi:probable F420-dependent oxidoreductase